MKEDVKLILLKLVKSNGGVQPLISLGYEYSQIIDFLNELNAEGLLEKSKNKVSITGKGIEKITMLNKKYDRINSARWIEPEIASRTTRIEKDFVFLPNKNELSF